MWKVEGRVDIALPFAQQFLTFREPDEWKMVDVTTPLLPKENNSKKSSPKNAALEDPFSPIDYNRPQAIPKTSFNGGGVTDEKTSPGSDVKLKTTSPFWANDPDDDGEVRLTAKSAHRMEQQIQMNMIKHNLAGHHFATRQFWLFTVPQALLTMATSILAFVATTDFFSTQETVFINVVVGSTSAVVVFLQTMSGICSYETRGKMHDAVALDLRHLRDNLVLLKFKLGFENEQRKKHANMFREDHPVSVRKIEAGDDSDGVKKGDKNEHQSLFEQIQSRFEQSLAGCKSNVPMELSEAFHGINSHLLLASSKNNIQFMVQKYGSLHDMVNLEFKIYDCLATEILEHWSYPMHLPRAKIMVKRTLKRFKREMAETDKFLDHEADDEDEVKNCLCYRLV